MHSLRRTQLLLIKHDTDGALVARVVKGGKQPLVEPFNHETQRWLKPRELQEQDVISLLYRPDGKPQTMRMAA